LKKNIFHRDKQNIFFIVLKKRTFTPAQTFDMTQTIHHGHHHLQNTWQTGPGME